MFVWEINSSYAAMKYSSIFQRHAIIKNVLNLKEIGDITYWPTLVFQVNEHMFQWEKRFESGHCLSMVCPFTVSLLSSTPLRPVSACTSSRPTYESIKSSPPKNLWISSMALTGRNLENKSLNHLWMSIATGKQTLGQLRPVQIQINLYLPL